MLQDKSKWFIEKTKEHNRWESAAMSNRVIIGEKENNLAQKLNQRIGPWLYQDTQIGMTFSVAYDDKRSDESSFSGIMKLITINI